MTTITLKNNYYLVQFPYDPTTVAMMKRYIPGPGRRWDPQAKLWQVDTQYESGLRDVFPGAYIPTPVSVKVQAETRVIDLRYLGQVKDRGNGEFTAFGYVNNEWAVIFSERILRAWFEGLDNTPPGDTSTLYGILGLPRTASPDEIKTGYRRMARQWHPDVCREPNAAEIFMRIREAYDALSNPKMKARYDVGLSFAAQQPQPIPAALGNGYRAPLRCGYVLAEGVESLGRFAVSKILGWEDVVDNQGRTLVVSWIMGDDKPREVWV